MNSTPFSRRRRPLPVAALVVGSVYHFDHYTRASDVAFRAAPLKTNDAIDLMRSIRGQRCSMASR